jgi:hypothetical protein
MPVIAARKNRVPLHLELRVSGRDVAGAPFAESTRTLNVSAGGLCFESRARLCVSGTVTLHIQVPPPLRFRFGGRAVYRVRAIICRVEWLSGQPFARVGARFLQEVEA